MKEKIKTSVIIPIYNTEKYLDECIQSVLNQTQKEVEIILVNDGSTDNSSRIIDWYAKEYDNIIVIHQNNQKLGVARNNGYKKANGEFVYFLDSDDYIAEDMLERCYAHAEKENLDFLFFDASPFCEQSDEIKTSRVNDYDRSSKNIDEVVMAGKEYWTKYFKYGGVFSCTPLTYIRREYIKKYDLFFEKNIVYEDMDWIVRMYRNARRVSYFPHKLYFRRYRKGSITHSKFLSIHINSAMYILKKLVYLRESYADIKSKQMVDDILNIMISTLYSILKNIDKDLMGKELLIIIHDLLKQEKAIENIDKGLYIKICFIIEFCIKTLKKNFVEYEEIEKVYVTHQIKFDNFIRNKYKLENPINIGIYGIGKMCDEIFNWYEKRNISIRANISFIVTKGELVTYKGYPVYEIEQLSDTEFDYIIISSTAFAEEMLENLENRNVTAKEYFKTYGYLNNFLEVENK